MRRSPSFFRPHRVVIPASSLLVLVSLNHHIVSSPGAEATGEGAMQAFSSPVIRDFLLPYWNEGAIISHLAVERR